MDILEQKITISILQEFLEGAQGLYLNLDWDSKKLYLDLNGQDSSAII